MTRKKSLVPKELGVQLRAVGHVQRQDVLPSRTYRIRPPTVDKYFYITISDQEVEGQLRPFEIFFSSKHAIGFEYLSALARIISSRLQEPGPFPTFLVEELMETFDTTGGYFVSEDWLRPKNSGLRVNGVVSHIGHVLKHHCASIGLDLRKGDMK